MEKYRKFADAPTGIQPFVTVVSPSKKTLPLCVLMFPLRMTFCTLFFLLILITDVLCYIFYALHLSFIPRLLLIHLLRRYALRGFFFFLGHLLPVSVANNGGNGATGGGGGTGPQGPNNNNNNNTSASSSTGGGRHRLRRGDILVLNLQSPWDPMLVEIALGLPFYAVAFPVLSRAEDLAAAGGGGGGGAKNSRQGRPNGKEQRSQGGKRVEESGSNGDRSAAAASDGGSAASGRTVQLFLPGPLQRWRILLYILSTNRPSYLRAQAAGLERYEVRLAAAAGIRSASHSPPPPPQQQRDGGHHKRQQDGRSRPAAKAKAGSNGGALPPINVGVDAQYSANRYGVPLLYFLEGTSSNGKGILAAPPFTCYREGAFYPKKANASGSGSGSDGSASSSTARAVTAVTPLEDAAGGVAGQTEEVCRVWTAAVYHQSPALPAVLPTPLFPHYLWRCSCLLYGSAVGGPAPFFPRVFVCLHACRLEVRGDEDPMRPTARSPLLQMEISEASLLAVRQALCRTPQSMWAGAGAGAARLANRRVLTVGFAEKLGYVTTATGQSAGR